MSYLPNNGTIPFSFSANSSRMMAGMIINNARTLPVINTAIYDPASTLPDDWLVPGAPGNAYAALSSNAANKFKAQQKTFTQATAVGGGTLATVFTVVSVLSEGTIADESAGFPVYEIGQTVTYVPIRSGAVLAVPVTASVEATRYTGMTYDPATLKWTLTTSANPDIPVAVSCYRNGIVPLKRAAGLKPLLTTGLIAEITLIVNKP